MDFYLIVKNMYESPPSENVPVRCRQQTTQELSPLDAEQQEQERRRDAGRERAASSETTLHHTLTDMMTCR